MKYIQQKKPDKSTLNNLRHVWKYHIGCQIAIRLYKYYNNDMYSIIIINTLRFLLSVSESVTDVGVAVTNLRVPLDMGTTVPNCNHGNVYSQLCTCAV